MSEIWSLRSKEDALEILLKGGWQQPVFNWSNNWKEERKAIELLNIFGGLRLEPDFSLRKKWMAEEIPFFNGTGVVFMEKAMKGGGSTALANEDGYLFGACTEFDFEFYVTNEPGFFACCPLVESVWFYESLSDLIVTHVIGYEFGVKRQIGMSAMFE